MTLKEELINAGYKEFTSGYDKEFTKTNYQKCYPDIKGRKYFINVKEYDFHQLPKPHGFEFSFDSQFETPNGSIQIQTVQWFFSDNEYHTAKTLKDVEELFEKLWQACGSIYYEENE